MHKFEIELCQPLTKRLGKEKGIERMVDGEVDLGVGESGGRGLLSVQPPLGVGVSAAKSKAEASHLKQP